MPGLEDFKDSISEMPDHRLDEILNKSRNERSTPSSSTNEEDETDDLPDDISEVDMDELTPEQAQKLLDKLG